MASNLVGAARPGCTIVIKPSEVAPLSVFLLAEVLDDLGLPPGVVNVVTGRGPVAGEALVGHPEIDMISFTGSTRAGRRISEIAAATVKPVALELGGKSPSIALDQCVNGQPAASVGWWPS
jgi:acyl-CoA reductase-like NAD-dependent aldehyde dehydrogenase